LLGLVGIPAARQRLVAYPHQLSGGMRRRVMIAIALSCEPALQIADEPTTALDVTIEAQILVLLRRLQERTGMAVLFITHNLGVVAEIADRVIVMYSGRVVEQADVRPLFRRPLMPYTAGLLRSVPRLDFAGRRGEALPTNPGNVPDPRHPPPGCAFHPRCDHSQAGRCNATALVLEQAEDGRHVRCLRWREIPEPAVA
jgi:oligopeptide transport system ATP-binding protein